MGVYVCKDCGGGGSKSGRISARSNQRKNSALVHKAKQNKRERSRKKATEAKKMKRACDMPHMPSEKGLISKESYRYVFSFFLLSRSRGS